MALPQSQRGSTPARPQREHPCRTEAHDRNHGVFGAASPGVVAMPGDAVVAVAVKAEARGHEWFAHLAGVCVVEPSPQLSEAGMRRRRDVIGKTVETDQSRDIEHPVVHLATLGAPWDGDQQFVEQRSYVEGRGFADPSGARFDPGSVPKIAPLAVLEE